jgi:DNA invertase Pin-like site-specific DNA recombinase
LHADAFAEFERAMIRDRTSTGLAAARAEGRVGGRRKKLDTSRLYNISQPTVSRIVAQHRIDLA